MDGLARAERYRDALHDLPDMPASQSEIDTLARELAEAYFDACVKKDDCLGMWLDLHWDDFISEAMQQLRERRDEE